MRRHRPYVNEEEKMQNSEPEVDLNSRMLLLCGAAFQLERWCATVRYLSASVQCEQLEQKLRRTQHTLEIEELTAEHARLKGIRDRACRNAAEVGGSEESDAENLEWMRSVAAEREKEMRTWANEHVLRRLRNGAAPDDMQSLKEIHGRFEGVEPECLRARLVGPALAYVLGHYQRGEDPEEFGEFRPLLVEFREVIGKDPDPSRVLSMTD